MEDTKQQDDEGEGGTRMGATDPPWTARFLTSARSTPSVASSLRPKRAGDSVLIDPQSLDTTGPSLRKRIRWALAQALGRLIRQPGIAHTGI